MQEQFVELLRKKGVGPTMGKSLHGEDFALLDNGFSSPSVNLTTKATMLTALLTLEKNPEEAAWLENRRRFQAELEAFFGPSEGFLALIQKAIGHSDLSREEFARAMGYLLDEKTPEYLKGAFLEAERLKRETFEENMACYDFLWGKSRHWTARVPFLIDLSFAYDGMTPTPLFAVKLAKTLGAAGFPTLLHGVFEVAPKKGMTVHKLLLEMGENPLKTPDEVIADIENPGVGWGYLDQRYSFPELHNLIALRTNMVKRPILATMEKLLQPIRAAQGNLLVTGYTHPPYKDMLVRVLKTAKHSPKFLVVRGAEGSAQLPMDRRAPYVLFDGKMDSAGFVRPEDFGIAMSQGEANESERDSVQYCGQMILTAFGLVSKESAFLASIKK
jgi:anthranilate phosphoribosyltransferase